MTSSSIIRIHKWVYTNTHTHTPVSSPVHPWQPSLLPSSHFLLRPCARISLVPQQELPTFRNYPWLWKCLVSQFSLVTLRITVACNAQGSQLHKQWSEADQFWNTTHSSSRPKSEQQWSVLHFSLLHQHHHSGGKTNVNSSLWWEPQK